MLKVKYLHHVAVHVPQHAVHLTQCVHRNVLKDVSVLGAWCWMKHKTDVLHRISAVSG